MPIVQERTALFPEQLDLFARITAAHLNAEQQQFICILKEDSGSNASAKMAAIVRDDYLTVRDNLLPKPDTEVFNAYLEWKIWRGVQRAELLAEAGEIERQLELYENTAHHPRKGVASVVIQKKKDRLQEIKQQVLQNPILT